MTDPVLVRQYCMDCWHEQTFEMEKQDIVDIYSDGFCINFCDYPIILPPTDACYWCDDVEYEYCDDECYDIEDGFDQKAELIEYGRM